MRIFNALPSFCLPALPGFEGSKTYAAWPVWSGSTTKEIRFQPMPKKAATKLWHRARDFDRQTRREGKHGGAVVAEGTPEQFLKLDTLTTNYLSNKKSLVIPKERRKGNRTRVFILFVNKSLPY